MRAAEALGEGVSREGGDCSVAHVDALDYVSKLFQRVYDKTYISMVRRAPEMMGLLVKRPTSRGGHPRPRLALDRLNTQPMIRMLKREQPDLCIATHFLPAEIPAWPIAKKKLVARNAIVVTDYDVHALWLCRTVDRVFLALPESAEYLARIGMRREKLRVTGIPVDPVFEKPVSQGEARRKFGLDDEARVLLIAAGGYGLGPVEQLVKDLLAPNRRADCAIALEIGEAEETAGRGDTRRRETCGRAAEAVAVGFTNEMDQYMAAADLLIGKAGGLTTSEALARGLPMALVEPIPGQEARNADHLLEAGAAMRCNNLPAAAWKIAMLLDQPERLAGMQHAASQMGRPEAARRIVEDALGLHTLNPCSGELLEERPPRGVIYAKP